MSSEEKPSIGLSCRITEGPLHISVRFLSFYTFRCLCVDLRIDRFLASEMWDGDLSRRDRLNTSQKSNETYEEQMVELVLVPMDSRRCRYGHYTKCVVYLPKVLADCLK